MGKRTLTGNVFIILLLQQFLLAAASALFSEGLHQNGGALKLFLFENFFQPQVGTSHHSRPDLSLCHPRPLLPLRPSKVFFSALSYLFCKASTPPTIAWKLILDAKRGESEGKEEAALERTSWLQDLKYIFSVKSFVLNAVGKVDNLIQVPKNHLLQVLPVSPSPLGPWLTSPQSTLRLESTLLQRAALAMTQNLSPLTRTLSTLS